MRKWSVRANQLKTTWCIQIVVTHVSIADKRVDLCIYTVQCSTGHRRLFIQFSLTRAFDALSSSSSFDTRGTLSYTSNILWFFFFILCEIFSSVRRWRACLCVNHSCAIFYPRKSRWCMRKLMRKIWIENGVKCGEVVAACIFAIRHIWC